MEVNLTPNNDYNHYHNGNFLSSHHRTSNISSLMVILAIATTVLFLDSLGSGASFVAYAQIASPTHVASIADTAELELGGAWGMDTVTIDGRLYAVVAGTTDHGIQIIDITNPGAPTPVGVFNLEGLEYERPRGVSTFTDGEHTYAFVTNQRNYFINILNLTNPASPTAVSSIMSLAENELRSPQEVDIVDVDGRTYAIVAGEGDDGVQIIDVTDPGSPTLTSRVRDGDVVGDTTFVFKRPIAVSAVKIDDYTYAVVTNFDDFLGGIHIINMTTPNNPFFVSNVTDTTELVLADAIDVDVITFDGNTYAVVAANGDGGGIQIIDITDPKMPVPLGNLVDADHADLLFGGIFSVSTILIDGYAYALTSSINENGIQIINITDPTDPDPLYNIADNSQSDNIYFENPRGVDTVFINNNPYALVPDFGNIVNTFDPATDTSAGFTIINLGDHKVFSASSTPTISDDVTTTIHSFVRSASSTPTISDDVTTTMSNFVRSASTTPTISDSGITLGMFDQSVSTTPTISDDITTIHSFVRSASSTPMIMDAATADVMFKLSASTIPDISDNILTVAEFVRSASTTPTISDQGSAIRMASLTVSSMPTVTSTASVDGITRSASSTPMIIDTATADVIFKQSASTNPTITDDTTTERMVTRSASTNPIITDDATTERMVTRSASTNPIITDDATTERMVTRSASTTPTITDDTTTTGSFTISASTTPTITDDTTTERMVTRSVSTTPTITDDTTTTGSFTISASSTPTITDDTTTERMVTRSASTTPTITDDTTTTGSFTISASGTPTISDTARADTQSSISASTTPAISDAVTTLGQFTLSASSIPAISDASRTIDMFSLSASSTPTVSDGITSGNFTISASTTPIIFDLGRIPYTIELTSARTTSNNTIVLQFNQEVRTDSSSFADIEIPVDTPQTITDMINQIIPPNLGIITLVLTPGELSTQPGKINITSSLTDVFGNTYNSTDHTIHVGLGYSSAPLTQTDNRVVITTADSMIETINIPRDVSGIFDLSLIADTVTSGNNAITNVTTSASTPITIKLAAGTDDQVIVVIQPSTSFTQSISEFNGMINLPAVRDESAGTCPAEFTETDDRIASCIDIGLENAELAISKPVKITFTGESGNTPYFGAEPGAQRTIINNMCNSESDPSVGEDMISYDNATLQECYYDDGDDIHIWTTHFTSFGTIAPPPVPEPSPEQSRPSDSGSGSPNRSGGGGGGGSGSIRTGPQGGSDAVNPVIYEARWNVCDDANDLYIMVGPDTTAMVVTTTQVQNGLRTATLTNDTSIPGKHVYQTTVEVTDPYVYISVYSISGRSGFVETATLKMDLDSCEGNFVFKEYVEPIQPTANPILIPEPTMPEPPTPESPAPEQTIPESTILKSIPEPTAPEPTPKPQTPEQTIPEATTPPTSDTGTDSESSFIDRLFTSVISIIENIFSIFSPAGTSSR